MMQVIQNTLYVLTQGAFLRRDHQTVQVEVEQKKVLNVPLHNLEAIAAFGQVMVTPEMLHLCAGAGVPVTFLSRTGRLLARVDAPTSGNVLLRREQYRKADDEGIRLGLCKAIVAGKLQNSRGVLLRAARDNAEPEDAERLRDAAKALASSIRGLEGAQTPDEVRGYEGEAAKNYFGVLSHAIRHNRSAFAMNGRTRRPPRDRTNCLLSFTYALLLTDCIGALAAAGLDPNVGYLHTDRPGRPSLALDLMEEFRPLLADRLVLALVNLRQVGEDGFRLREGGAVELTDSARKAVVSAWHKRKQEEVMHPILQHRTKVGLLPHLQAKILARHIRGELPAYAPCVMK